MRVRVYSYPAGKSLCGKGSSLSRFLQDAWKTKLKDGTIKYTPPRQRTKIGRFEIAINVGRTKKPHPPSDESALITKPHEPCVFDKPEIAAKEAVARIVAPDQEYLLFVNVFPIFWESYVLVRDPSAPEERLSQYIQCPEDIMDLCLINQTFPARLRFLFNANSAGKTNAGASKNHWHLHVAPFGHPLREQYVSPITKLNDNMIFGKIPGWPANLRILEGTNFETASQLAFDYVNFLNDRNNSYNLVFMKYRSRRERVVLIPRTYGAPKTRFHGLAANIWGGDFHCGTLFETDPTVVSLMKKHILEANEVIAQRLRETTFPDEKMEELDRLFLRNLP